MLHRIRTFAISLVSLEALFVASSVFASIISQRLLPVAVGVAGLFWLIRWFALGRPSVRTPADYPIMLLVLLLPITLWITNFPDTTREQVLRLLSGIGLFYAIVNWTHSTLQLRWLLSGAFLCGFGLICIAPFTVAWIPSKVTVIPPALYRSFQLMVSDSINPSVLAGSLVILFPYLFAMLLWQRMSILRRTVLVVAIVLTLGTVILSQSRGGWIGLSAALLVMIIIRWRRGWLLLLVPVVGAMAAVWFLGLGRTVDILTTDRSFGGLSGRKEVWVRALYLIRDFPLTGIGMGSFEQISGALYPFQNPLWRIPHAHNIFLTVAVDLGIPGLIAWLAVIFVVIATAWQTYKYGLIAGDGLLVTLGVGTVGSQIALMGHGLTDAVTWGMVRPAVFVWALWGISIAAWRYSQKLSATAYSSDADPLVKGVQPSGTPQPSRSVVHALKLRWRRQ